MISSRSATDGGIATNISIMSYYSGTSESPEISQGSDAEGQHDEPAVTATTATVTFGGTTSSSGVSAIVYFGLCWIVLLSLIVALVCVSVECRCRKDQKLQQEQQQQQQQSSPVTPHDVEVAEPVVVAVNSRSRKIHNVIGLTILFVGSLFGLGLSIFSIMTCEFVTLEEPVTLDASFADRLSITIYSLGLMKVDLTSNSVLSGCVSTVNLPFLDTPYNFAKASAVIGAVFGGLCLLLLLCLVMNREFLLVVFKGRNLLLCFYSLACLFQLTTLTLFGSHYCEPSIFDERDGNCKPGIGVVASVSAALFWMLEVVAVACLPLGDT